jgi:hypothetical protein
VSDEWAANVSAALQIAAFVAGIYLGLEFSPWWFVMCAPCVASIIYGMKH